MRRRADIQGLRAIAVLAVVAFHAGLPVPGGFVGVDVFFVISGFVITAMLRREWEETGRIQFGAFYARRFRRLAPALALVILFTAVVAELVLSPLGIQETAAKTGVGAMLLAANWTVATTTGGYFDAPAQTNPLLHTWSLSVEEQFYLVFPAILAVSWLVARRTRRSDAPFAAVAVVGLLSFGAAVVGADTSVHSWLFGFYSPLTRAWEFAAGALLALTAAGGVTPRSPVLTRVCACSGAALVALSCWAIDGRTPFPGTWTLLPVAGTMLLLFGGAQPHATLVGRVLASRPLVKIGDWSYSIYLWHWPLIAFAGIVWPYSPDAPRLAALLALAPALFSYLHIEQPIRSLQTRTRRRFAVLVAVVVAVPALAATAMGAVAADYWTPRYESGRIPVANQGGLGPGPYFRDLQAVSTPCAARDLRAQALRWDGVLRCRQSKPGGAVSLALIGDSHAEHLFYGLARALPHLDVAYYLVDDAPTTSDPAFARIVDDVAASDSIDAVVVNAFWTMRGVPADLSSTLRRLKRPGRAVFVTDDVPSFAGDPFFCKFRASLLVASRCTMSAAEFRSEYAGYDPQLRAAAARAHVTVLRTAHAFCPAGACSMAENGRLLYRDENHLNASGSELVARVLLDEPAFARAVSGR